MKEQVMTIIKYALYTLVTFIMLEVLKFPLFLMQLDVYNETMLVLTQKRMFILFIWVLLLIVALSSEKQKKYAAPLLYATVATLIVDIVISMDVVIETGLDIEWEIASHVHIIAYTVTFILCALYYYVYFGLSKNTSKKEKNIILNS